MSCKLLDKLEFGRQLRYRAVPNGVTITGQPCTNWLRALRGKLEFGRHL